MVSQQGQITDRFTKAIEQLGAIDSIGKKKLEVGLEGDSSTELPEGLHIPESWKK